MRAHHGSVGCRSTPLTRSVRCTSCFCKAHNRNDGKQTEGALCGRAGTLLDSTNADQKCRVAGRHARLAREGTRQGGGWETADGDLGPLTFTSSRSGCATGCKRAKQTSELAKPHPSLGSNTGARNTPFLLESCVAGAASLLLLQFTRAASFGLWVCLASAVGLGKLPQTQHQNHEGSIDESGYSNALLA